MQPDNQVTSPRSQGKGQVPKSLVVLLLVVGPAAQAEDVDVRFATPQGTSWSVEQELGLRHEAMGLAAAFGLGRGAEGWISLTLKERYIDVVVEDRHGRPTKIRRTYRVSEATEEGEDGGERDSVDTSLLDVTIVVSEEGEGSIVETEKGVPADGILALLHRSAVEPVLCLLPKSAVHQGQEWTVDEEAIGAFRRGMYADGIGALDENVATEVLAAVDSFAGATLTAKVATVTDDEVTIEYAGKSEIGGTKSIELGGIKVEGSPGVTVEMKGTLVFSRREGRPVRLEWSESRSARASGKIEVPGIGAIGSEGGAGAKQEWKVTRRYASIE